MQQPIGETAVKGEGKQLSSIFIDPEALELNELLSTIPTIGPGIQLGSVDLNEVNGHKLSEASNIAINVSEAFQVTPVSADEAKQEPEEIEAAESDHEVSIIETEGENLQEFWQKESAKSQDTTPFSELKRAKKWAIEADPKLVKEYEKIKPNMAFKVHNFLNF